MLFASVVNLCTLQKFLAGMCVDALKEIYRSVVLAKLIYASPAWFSFATTSDLQRIEAFVRRGVRLGLCGSNDPTLTQPAEDSDERLFRSINTASITPYNSFSQNTAVTATVFDLVATTLS